MKIIPSKLPGVFSIEPMVHGDERGFFLETFQKQRYAEAGIALDFVQDNHSRSSKGILRGLHFQVERPQGKLVRCVRGEVFDVVVDIDEKSSTYGQWEGFKLTEENMSQVWVPPGFAHGFLVLSEVADFEYKCTDYYEPALEKCLIWNDPSIGIDWPINQEPILSERDKRGESLEHL